jgi:protein TonB
MFDVVRGRTSGPTRLGPALVLAISAHALLLAGALLLSHPAPRPRPEPPIPGWPTVSTRAGRPSAPAGPSAPAVPPKAHRPPVPRRPPEQHPLARRPEPSPAPAPDPGASAGDSPGTGAGQGSGDVGEAPGCATPPCGAGAGLYSEDVVAEMPVLLSGPEVQLSPEARRAGAEGTVRLRCVIAASGAVESCEVLEGRSLAEAGVLAALEARRYRPAQLDGRPVAVRHLFTVRVRSAPGR